MALKLLLLKNYPILAQLQLEEACLRNSCENICIINEGAPDAIVLGITNRIEEINTEQAKLLSIPLIRRFSAGGTVIIDSDTLLVTFICNDSIAQPQPLKLLQFCEQLFKPWIAHAGFKLQEQDFVIHDRKVGGNAQYIQKNRWVQHSCFLWNYSLDKMKLLHLPQRQPAYRNQREHQYFLTTLQTEFKTLEQASIKLYETLKLYFEIELFSLEEALYLSQKAHRCTTHQIV